MRRRTYHRHPRRSIAAALTITAAVVAAIAVPLGQAVAQVAPANTAEPTISGSAVTGQQLTATNGSWSGAPSSFSYQWLRCDTAGANCAPVSSATASSYTLADADVDRRMRVRVTATNADGSTSVQSNATDTVRAAGTTGPPVNTKDPSIAGTARVGQVLRASPGEWSGAQPITYSFQWSRCDTAGNNCVTIGGATDDAYTVREADLDRTLRARVSARNAAGTGAESTSQTARVQTAEGPAGAIKLANGETSIPASSVPASESLVVDQVTFDPTTIRSRTASFNVRIKIKDTRGFVVRDALVFIRSTPLVTSRGTDRDTPTGQDGFAAVTMTPQRDFPELNPAYAVQFYVKAYRAGDPVLGGIAGTRLVQVQLGR
jgi:hypothetical protein